MRKKLSVMLSMALAVMPVLAAFATTARAESVGACTIYRLYNPGSNEHFYTISVDESNSLVTDGWNYEGVGWVAPEKSNSPVYRLFNTITGDHHYTMSAYEKDVLSASEWINEGIAFYSDDGKEVPLYREFFPGAVTGAHNYTISINEHRALTTRFGWNDEGIGWYALNQPGQEDSRIIKRPADAPIREPIITDAMRALSNETIETGEYTSGEDENNVPYGFKYYMDRWGQNYDAKWLTDTSVKELHLTIDEGYETGNTPAILDVLKAKNVKATFFITKYFADTCPELVARMIAEGHTVGNHTCSHPDAGMPSLSLEEQAADVLKLQNQIRKDFNYEMKVFRYPSGKFSDQSLALMNDMGYSCIFWSFAHRDWDPDDQPDPAESLVKMKDKLHPGAIYLLHGVSTTDTEVLPAFIDYARSLGYSLKQF